MGLVPYQGVDVPPEKRWSFCGEPYTFEKYLTFCVEMLEPKTRSEMAQLGLLGYRFEHILPLSGPDREGTWVSILPKHGAITSNMRLHDTVMSTMAWHIQKEIEDIHQRVNAAHFGKSGFAP
jgi:hypothetical protein